MGKKIWKIDNIYTYITTIRVSFQNFLFKTELEFSYEIVYLESCLHMCLAGAKRKNHTITLSIKKNFKQHYIIS